MYGRKSIKRISYRSFTFALIISLWLVYVRRVTQAMRRVGSATGDSFVVLVTELTWIYEHICVSHN